METPTLDQEDNLLKEYSRWSLYLHPAQYTLGHAVAVLNSPTSYDPFIDATASERREFVVVTSRLQKCLRKLWRPVGYDYRRHHADKPPCHLQIIPRYDKAIHVMGELFVDKDFHQGTSNFNQERFLSLPVFTTIREQIRDRL